jgi:hypothetical protein
VQTTSHPVKLGVEPNISVPLHQRPAPKPPAAAIKRSDSPILVIPGLAPPPTRITIASLSAPPFQETTSAFPFPFTKSPTDGAGTSCLSPTSPSFKPSIASGGQLSPTYVMHSPHGPLLCSNDAGLPTPPAQVDGRAIKTSNLKDLSFRNLRHDQPDVIVLPSPPTSATKSSPPPFFQPVDARTRKPIKISLPTSDTFGQNSPSPIGRNISTHMPSASSSSSSASTPTKSTTTSLRAVQIYVPPSLRNIVLPRAVSDSAATMLTTKQAKASVTTLTPEIVAREHFEPQTICSPEMLACRQFADVSF